MFFFGACTFVKNVLIKTLQLTKESWFVCRLKKNHVHICSTFFTGRQQLNEKMLYSKHFGFKALNRTLFTLLLAWAPHEPDNYSYFQFEHIDIGVIRPNEWTSENASLVD